MKISLKNAVFILCTMLILIFVKTPTDALNEQITDKTTLPYEISAITSGASSFEITGWAFLNETQHFQTSADHNYEIEFSSPAHTFRSRGMPTAVSQTEIMKFAGTSACAPNLYYQPGRTCFYYYENVGFKILVPYGNFKYPNKYTAYIVVTGITSKRSLKIPLYFPMNEDIVKKIGDIEYRAISKMDDTKLQINHTTVMTLMDASKTSPIWYYGTSCSSTYGNRLYYQYGSIFSTIYEKKIAESTTYYRLSGALSVCNEQRRRVVEGTQLSPLWIASNFVDYTGTPLQITSTLINTVPDLIVENVTLTVGDMFNPFEYVSAYDVEEGNLTQKIMLVSSNFVDAAGIYSLTFKVSDKYNATVTKTMIVTVNKKNNNAPIINASDRSLLKNSQYDPRTGVSAEDIEDGDITEKIEIMNTIDLQSLTDQEQCYAVTDSQNSRVEKCVTITVFDIDSAKRRFRFISKNNLFYSEPIPSKWIGLIDKLTIIVHSEQQIVSNIIEN